jgi:hypothetical protein
VKNSAEFRGKNYPEFRKKNGYFLEKWINGNMETWIIKTRKHERRGNTDRLKHGNIPRNSAEFNVNSDESSEVRKGKIPTEFRTDRIPWKP